MTDCTTEPLLFSSLKRKNIRADFRGGRLTSDGGALLLREVDRSLGLIDAINACIRDPRNPFCTVHSQRALLAQRIFGIALGYEDLNDHDELRSDPMLAVALGKDAFSALGDQQLAAHLKASGEYDDTLIVFTCDHGEMGEAVGYFPQDSTGLITKGLTAVEWLHQFDPDAARQDIHGLLGHK